MKFAPASARLGAEIGDKVAVGSDLVRLRIPGERDAASAAQPQPSSDAAEAAKTAPVAQPRVADSEDRGTAMSAMPTPRPAQPAEPQPALLAQARADAIRPVASPAVRLRAREAGIDLRQVSGTGPAGRGRSHSSRGFGRRSGLRCESRRKARSRSISSVFLRPNRTSWSALITRRRCR
jgi:2-oxoisovalerate dehydrogenase E2 component (dihydrolipoyl transacylase)